MQVLLSRSGVGPKVSDNLPRDAHAAGPWPALRVSMLKYLVFPSLGSYTWLLSWQHFPPQLY